MSRDWQLYLEDMLVCCSKVLDYTRGLELPGFLANAMVYDAVVGNLEILGETAKNIPAAVQVMRPVMQRAGVL